MMWTFQARESRKPEWDSERKRLYLPGKNRKSLWLPKKSPLRGRKELPKPRTPERQKLDRKSVV